MSVYATMQKRRLAAATQRTGCCVTRQDAHTHAFSIAFLEIIVKYSPCAMRREPIKMNAEVRSRESDQGMTLALMAVNVPPLLL